MNCFRINPRKFRFFDSDDRNNLEHRKLCDSIKKFDKAIEDVTVAIKAELLEDGTIKKGT